MAVIDVRDDVNETVDKVVFGDESFIDGMRRRDLDINSEGDSVTILVDEVDDLIKALKAAKELCLSM